jgi:hypothetical protein
LLWLYLVSEKELNFFDAVQLIRSVPGLDTAAVRKRLQQHDPVRLAKLDAMLSKAREPEISYEASRARRS